MQADTLETVARLICRAVNRVKGYTERHLEYVVQDTWQDYLPDARAITPMVQAAERERCAEVAERLNGWGDDCGKGGHAMHIAAAIRAIGAR